MEPKMEENYKLWGDWSAPDKKMFAWGGYHNTHYNNNEWHLSKTYNELLTHHPKKDTTLDNCLSTVLSAKYKDTGHIKRVDFVKFLEKKGVNVHVYGSNKWEYKDYKGTLPSPSKG